MFFLAYHARQAATADTARAGALVSCWVNSATRAEAERRAKHLMATQEGWIIGDLKEIREVSRSSYDGCRSGLAYYEQALVDGEVCVFYTYPETDSNSD